MWTPSEADIQNRLSVLSANDVMSAMADSATATECKDTIIEFLTNQVRTYESECAAIKRSIPRLAQLRDLTGKDVTTEMTELSQKLTEKEYQLENANSMCAKKHEQLERVRDEMYRQLCELEQKVDVVTQRAKQYEEENRQLREQIENEQSRIFRLNQHHESSGTTDAETLCASQPNDNETIEKLQLDLNDRLSELEDAKKQTREWQVKFEQRNTEFADLKRSNEQLHKFVERMLSGQELRKSFLEKSLTGEIGSNADYVVANMLALLDLLDSNGREMNTLRSEIVAALRRNGYEANEANINALSQTLRQDISNRREKLQCQQYEAIDVSFNSAMNDITKNITNISFLNRTTEISQDAVMARRQMGSLRKVCTQLFEKLRGTAEFLEQILETLGETEEGRNILNKIQQLRLELDKSMVEATSAANEFEKAEKSMMDFCEMISQIFEASVVNDENSIADVSVFNEQLDSTQREKERLVSELQQLKTEKLEVLQKLECVQHEHSVELVAMKQRYEEAIEDYKQKLNAAIGESAVKLKKAQEEFEEKLEALRMALNEANEKLKVNESEPPCSIKLMGKEITSELGKIYETMNLAATSGIPRVSKKGHKK